MARLEQAPPRTLTAHLARIEAALQAALPNDGTPVASAARYVLGWEDAGGNPAQAGGKRIRPALCLFAAEASGADPEVAMPGAVGVELVHNFSLVHDEIQDHDAERHHRPTTWVRFGEAQAINVGDYLFTRATQALAQEKGGAGRRLRALEVLTEAIKRMVAGQWQDIAFEQRNDVSVEDYLVMVGGKTGALIGAALEIGALLAGEPRGQARILGHWGVAVGLAFQARDDYLGIWGAEAETGKSTTSDLARRKKSLPVVLALAHPEAGPAVRKAFAGPPTSQAVERLTDVLERTGIREKCRSIGDELASEAQSLLDRMPFDADQRGEFRRIAAYLVERRV